MLKINKINIPKLITTYFLQWSRFHHAEFTEQLPNFLSLSWLSITLKYLDKNTPFVINLFLIFIE